MTKRICVIDLSLDMIRRALDKPRTQRDLVFQGDFHFIPFVDGPFDRDGRAVSHQRLRRI
ncbi:MAG: class I SAM-dependent methyltransferase [Desulfatiglandaceae bacterium]